jgi:hypothetical protein
MKYLDESDGVGRGRPPMTAYKKPFLSDTLAFFNYTEEMGMVVLQDIDSRLLYTT